MPANQSNIVIDISHHNGTKLNFDKAKAAGIIGVIQKATQGENYVDATFKKNKDAALAAGLLFGAYHFGTGSNGDAQAAHFLDVVKPDANTVVVLDFESNPAGSSMDLEEARAFVTHIKSELGRRPGFYSGHDVKAALGTTVDPILKNCWFWLAQYGQRLSCRHAGVNGRCGNIPMAVSALILITSTASARATANFLMELTRN